MKKMIFHHPMPLDFQANSASGIRPVKLFEAFRELGYEVHDVSGYGVERKRKIAAVKALMERGSVFDFVYSESSTQATLLTEPNHIPRFPLLDFSFFRYCRRRGLRVGVFYRDLYWRFPDYLRSTGVLKGYVGRFFYMVDLFCYKHFVDKLYLPSWQMRPYISIVTDSQLDVLPPGCTVSQKLESTSSLASLRILYIGGLSSHYGMHKLLAAVSSTPGVELTICCREADWSKVKEEYAPYMSASTTVVHKSGNALRDLYACADVLSLVVEPTEYREFAMPFKLFEYVGAGKPILATRGTLSGDFVASHLLGWVLDYDVDSIRKLLLCLRDDRRMIADATAEVGRRQSENTWFARAQKVVADLSPEGCTN